MGFDVITNSHPVSIREQHLSAVIKQLDVTAHTAKKKTDVHFVNMRHTTYKTRNDSIKYYYVGVCPLPPQNDRGLMYYLYNSWRNGRTMKLLYPLSLSTSRRGLLVAVSFASSVLTFPSPPPGSATYMATSMTMHV